MAEKSLKDLSGALSKMAENSPKIQKDVEKIREAICGTGGLLEAILGISENIESFKNSKSLENIVNTKPNKNNNNKKLLASTNSISKTLNNILEQLKKNGSGKSAKSQLSGANFKRDNDLDKKKDRLGSISKALDIIERLKNISLKDFIFAKTKLKKITSIMKNALNNFRMFKDEKEMEHTMNFVGTSIDLVKKLAKMSLLSKPAKMGAKAIEAIFMGKDGKGGLLELFRKVDKHKKEIKQAKKDSKSIAQICGSLFLASLALAGVALIGPVVLIGALLSAGIIVVLLGTFKLMGKAVGDLTKGAIAFTILSAGLIAFSLGFGILRQAVEGLELSEVGIMLAAVGGTALAVAGIGLLSVPIALGGGAILIIGAALGILNLSLRAWTNFDATGPTDNIKYAVAGLKEVFGLGSKKNQDTGKVESRSLGGSIVDFISSIFQGGQALVEMGTILIATMAMAFVRLALSAWNNYDPSKAIGNLKNGVAGIKDAMGIDERQGESLQNKIGGTLTDAFDFISSVIQSGKVLAQMGTILLSTISMAIVRLALSVWDKYDPSTAIGNLNTAVTGLKNAFGIDERKENGTGFTGVLNQAVGSVFDALSFGNILMQSGKIFVEMGTILFAVGIMGLVLKTLKSYEKFDSTQALGNVAKTIQGIKKTFGMDVPEPKPEEEDNSIWGRIKSFAKKTVGTVGDYLNAAVDQISGFYQTASAVFKFGPKFVQLGEMLMATGTMSGIYKALKPWDKFDSSKSISNIKSTLTNLKSLLSDNSSKLNEDDAKNFKDSALDIMMGMNYISKGASNGIKTGERLTKLNEGLSNWSNTSFEHAKFMARAVNVIRWSFDKVDGDSLKDKSKSLMKLFKTLHDNDIQESLSSVPLNGSVNAINALDLSKAQIMMELFKTIGLVKDKRPFDLFDQAVDKFVDGCHTIVESISNMANPESKGGSNIFGFDKKKSNSETAQVSGGVNITNTAQLAQAIAQALRNLNIRINPGMIDVNLIAEGISGKTVKLTVQD